YIFMSFTPTTRDLCQKFEAIGNLNAFGKQVRRDLGTFAFFKKKSGRTARHGGFDEFVTVEIGSLQRQEPAASGSVARIGVNILWKRSGEGGRNGRDIAFGPDFIVIP